MKRTPITRKTPMRRFNPKRPGFHFGVDWDGPCITGEIEQPNQAANRPAKRSGNGLPRSSSLRSKQRRQYNRMLPIHLAAHPFCQITIAVLGLDEARVIAAGGTYLKHGPKYPPKICKVARATQLHHRNKANGIRLIDFDYVMTACDAAHGWTELKKDHARRLGILCPINCRPDGTMPDGTKQPTTTELLASRHAAK